MQVRLMLVFVPVVPDQTSVALHLILHPTTIALHQLFTVPSLRKYEFLLPDRVQIVKRQTGPCQVMRISTFSTFFSSTST